MTTTNNSINNTLNNTNGSGGVTLSSQAQAQIIACLEKLDFILANQIRLERILLSRGMIDSSESGDTSQENAVNA